MAAVRTSTFCRLRKSPPPRGASGLRTDLTQGRLAAARMEGLRSRAAPNQARHREPAELSQGIDGRVG